MSMSGELVEWLRSLELEEYTEAFEAAGYTGLRFVQIADINEIVADVKMKRPHVRVFTPAWAELVEASTVVDASTISEGGSPERSERKGQPAVDMQAGNIGKALSARTERLASMRSEGSGAGDLLDSASFVTDDPSDGDEHGERAPLVLGEPSRPAPEPSPLQSPAEFRAEITARLLGEVNSAIQNATPTQSLADPNTPQLNNAANRSLRAISSTIRSILATANATGETRSPPISPRQLELEQKPEPEPEPEPELDVAPAPAPEPVPAPEPEPEPEPELETGPRLTRHFAAGEDIIVEGEEGHEYYYLQEGEAVVIVSGFGEIERKHAGEGFGEHALLFDIPRTATVKAVTDCECVVLTLNEYQKLAGELREAKMLSSLASTSAGRTPVPLEQPTGVSTVDKAVRTVDTKAPKSNEEGATDVALPPRSPPHTHRKSSRLWQKTRAASSIGAVATAMKTQGTRIADIHKGWNIEHGFVMFTGAKMDRGIRNDKAQSALQAQQGAFLKISGDPSIGIAFNSLPTLVDRQRRVRQLLAVLETFEQEWGLHMPPMIVSVTGNALPFDMRPKFHAIFAQALLKATQATGAWVTTGGTDAGVMKLVGDAMKFSNTPVLGVSTWGVIKGRQRLSRPSQADIRNRIFSQIRDRNDRAPIDEVKNVGTADNVTREYALYKAKSWADSQSLPNDVGERVTFIENHTMATLDELGLISHEGRPDLTLRYPFLRTGKIGRGDLGRWGPNHAIDTIVTRRPPKERNNKAKDEKEQTTEADPARQSSSGLQVALVFREEDQVWAIPGKFVRFDEVMIMSSVEQGQRLTGELPTQETDDPIDRARLAVRQVFELEGASSAGHSQEYEEMFDDIFKKSWQTLVYRGYSDDPRNTNEAWVETSAWHLHCPIELVHDLEKGYSDVSEQVMWMDVVVTGPRLEFQDEFGNKYDLFASHRELIELAVFGNVLGNHDMPFEYDGLSRNIEKAAADEIVHLNPNHSHYICVDDGTEGKFGAELNFRVEFETFMSCFDHTARRMGIAELTQHFTASMDESALHVAGEIAHSNKKSQVISIDKEVEPNIIPVVRTASDGKTKVEYTINVVRSDSENTVVTKRVNSSDEEHYSLDPTELEDAEDPDLPSQFSLKGMDVTRIVLSDGDIDFFPAVPFDPEVTQYDIVVPRQTREVTVTATLRAAEPKDIKRTVPIVVLCYGGGPFTIHTLASSGEKPIIIVSGSQRAAQYVEDWCSIEAQKADKRNDPDMVARLDALQKAQARRSLRMDLAGAKKTTYDKVAAAAGPKPDWWNVDSFLHALGKLGDHDYMHFFQINQTTTVKTSKKIRLNPMLPPLLDSIVKSPRVKQEVKLPLAIRLDHEDDVKILCDAHGIARNQNVDGEVSVDSRLLIFAAFNDQGKVVERLLDTGFALENLDPLIALEIQRELDRPKLIKENEPPAYWIAEHFPATQYSNQNELDILIALRWRRVERKEAVYRAISWNMMPSLPGWLMVVEQTEPEMWWPPGTMMQQLTSSFKVDEYPPNGLMVRDFVIVSPAHHAGKKLTGEDFVPEEGGVISIAFQDKTRDKPLQGVRAKMQPLYRDNVTEWLPLQSECKFRLPVSRVVAARERSRVARAFSHWLTCDESPKNHGQPNPNLGMHELHRIYWAIRSNRPRLAKVLMTRCSYPVLGSLFSAKIYRHQRLPADYVPDANLKPKFLPKAMRASSEAYACEILDNAEFNGSNSAFDSFVFYGIDQEQSDDYINFVTKEKDQIENTKIRQVLQLMGVDERTEVTNIDLALLANSKTFMTQNGVMQFLMKLWTRPSDNGNWLQRKLPITLQIARVKMLINLLGFGAFLVMYITLLNDIPPRGEEYVMSPFELVFWCWALAFALNELVEALGDYDTCFDYIRASGNAVDFIVIVIFVSAVVSRGYSLYQYHEDSYRQQIAAVNNPVLLSAADVSYAALCVNFVVCCFRFLMLLSMFERIGVMVIIVGKIVRHDIMPFLVFATTCITAFEAAAMFFSWLGSRQHIFGHFFQVFTGIGQSEHSYPYSTDMFGINPDLPEWDQSAGHVGWLAIVFQFAFFLGAIVILMNLLIAMMADTYTSVVANAEEEYQMQFAKIVKEGYETTVLPVPLNALEHLANRINPTGRPEEGKTSLQWGRHYTWPASTLPYQLQMAARKVQVKKDAEKAAKHNEGVAST